MDEAGKVNIVKNNGERQPFDRNKLIIALERAGASEGESQKVLQIVESKLFDGISAKKIYGFAYAELRKQKSHRTAGRYRLKSAIFNLGPTGFPFETFVSRLFESLGFSVEVGVMMQGECVKHEVDVLAKKHGQIVIVECKFHHDHRAKTGVQVPLYIHSRFQDVEAKWRQENPSEKVHFEGHVVTNTRFSQDAKDYAECAGLGMISWDYPLNNCLRSIIDRSGLHPLTSLHSLRRAEQKILLEQGIVLCSELESRQFLLQEMRISDRRITKILKEAAALIKN